MPTTITIGDVVFEPTADGDVTLKQTIYLMAEVAKSGIRPIEEYQKIGDDTARSFAIAADLGGGGHCFTLLAGIFRRRGEPWRQEQVAENVRLLENAKGDAAQQLIAMLAEVLVLVFASGSSSSTTSPIALPGVKRAAPSNSAAAAGSTTGRGTASSARSPVTTRSSTSASPTGRGGKRSSRTRSSSAMRH